MASYAPSAAVLGSSFGLYLGCVFLFFGCKKMSNPRVFFDIEIGGRRGPSWQSKNGEMVVIFDGHVGYLLLLFLYPDA